MQPIVLYRRLTQTAFFILTGQWLYIGWVRCPFGVPFVSCASCPLKDCWGTWLQSWFLWGLGIAALLLGRVFCAWGCPMGFVEDALAAIPKPRWLERKLASPKVARFGRRLDGRLKHLKWLSLAAVVFLIFQLDVGSGRAFDYVVRSPDTYLSAPVEVATTLGSSHYAVRIGVLAVGLVLGVVVVRGWCRYLCPLGALLGLTNRISLFGVRRDEDSCVGCDRYPRECPQGTTPGTTDCTACAECIQGCSNDAVSLSLPSALRGTKRDGSERAS
jgi:polyferredoxin